MNNIGGTAGKGFRTSWMRIFLSLAVLFVTVMSAGCVGYEAHDPSPVGVFYPYEPVTVRGRNVNDASSARTNLYTIRQPTKISEVGTATYHDPQNAGKHEVARLEFWDCSVYVWADTLRQVGRIECTGNQAVTSKLWARFTDFWKSAWEIIMLVIGIIIILAIIGLFSGGGGGTWSGDGSTSTGGSWHGGGTFK